MPVKRRRVGAQNNPVWPTTKSITVGVLWALGFRSHEIARSLADGTRAESIRHQIARSELHKYGPIDGKRRVAVRMHPKAVIQAAKLAEEMGIPLETWAGRILEFAARDGMYDSIVDGETGAYES